MTKTEAAFAKEYQRKLKAERIVRGITQLRLSKELGITQGHMSYLESGKRPLTFERQQQICKIFEQYDRDVSQK